MTTDTPVLAPEDRPRLPIRRVLRRRRYPAGRAIAVVLLTLLFSALLDADSLVASVSSERFGKARSIELGLVRPFKSVSDALGLNLPHRWLADIAGTNQHDPRPIALPQPTAGGTVAVPRNAIAALIDPGPGRLAPHR